ncbi:MAG: putative transposon-encoded protein [Neolewinella sp.]
MWLEKKNEKRVKIKKLKEVEVEKAEIVFECSIAGLG